ncbi:hypothetical protein CYY_002258 [Polysphondylium violaceum]|uniref:Uncharacterized protein n=1 Tax=Polysphondylium violaceum TaxID=133409 RepID=A0A8J4V0Y7_9MYCE|nr:hypothetical protein CYY_002258 [Polysphondylium violaceum]
MEFKNKLVLITGGNRGIGLELTRSFLREGAFVSFIDVNIDGAFELSAEFGVNQLFSFKGDVSNENHLKSFVSETRERFPNRSIDIVVNNAMVSHENGVLSDIGFEQFTKIIQIGTVAPYYLTLLCKPYFSAEGASIVNIASTRAFQSMPNCEAYAAAKGGVVALTHALAVSLSEAKIRVNSVSPGWIDTVGYEPTEQDNKQHLVGRIGTTSDIVNAVFFLSSSKSSFITGQNIIVDGGMSKQMIYHGEHGWEKKL